MMSKPVIRFDGDRLRQVAGLELRVEDLLELAELVTVYRERFRKPETIEECPNPPKFMRADVEDLPKWELAARRAFVEAVWGLWSDCRRKRQRRARDERRRKKPKLPPLQANDGHCIKLIQVLLEMAGEKAPSSATLRYDLTRLNTGRERLHKRRRS